MSKELIVSDDFVKNKIYSIRGKQVMLDRDLAELYGVETKVLNQAVKRNIERFPEDFMFRLNKTELSLLKRLFNKNWMSQSVTSNYIKKGLRKLPYAFTEQGVAMLSSVLKSKKGVEVNIKIMRAFISMRKFLVQNSEVFFRLDGVERKQLEYQIKTDENFEKVFNALQLNTPNQGVFFEGEVFDAFKFISDLVKKAKHRIVLIDNYIDENTLFFFTKTNVEVLILTKNVSSKEITKYKQQYSNVVFKEFDKSHDRFLIIDDEVYLLGASLKDAGKKWFGFFKVHNGDVLKKIRSYF